MSSEEQLIERLKRMKFPEPPAGVKERSLRRYQDWLRSGANKNRWRD
jgi:hypothetical protein